MYQEIKDNDTLIELMSDKDTLISHLEASKENVDTKVSDKENEITKAIMDDWRTTEQRIIDEQQRRNRNIIEEIVKTAMQFRDDIGKNLILINEFIQRKNLESSEEMMNDIYFNKNAYLYKY